MAALWFALRAQLRAPRRLALTIGIAALVGVAGGAVLTAAAGARRTDTAYARLLEVSNAPEFVVRPVGGPDAVEPARIARLPQVAQSGEMRRYYFTIGTRGDAVDRPALFAAASVDGRALYTIGRPMVLDGRLPHPDRVNEVMVSRKVASDLGLEVGDALPGTILQLGDSEAEQIRSQNVRLHVVGIGIGADEIGFERVSGFQTLLTPAFYDRYPDFSVDWNELVTLKPGVDPADFRRAVREVAGTNTLDIASRADDVARVEKATNPPVVSLWVFALVLAAVSILVIGQTIARQLFVDSRDDPLLGALGLTRRERFLLGELRALPIAVLGAVLAFIVAVPGSLLMPIGVASAAEPSPGLEVNVAVLALGAVLGLVAILAAAAVPAWRLAGRRVGDDAASRGKARPARIPEALARAGAPPPAVAGTRFALESGRGPTAVPAFRADIDRVTAPSNVNVGAQADTTRQVDRSVVPHVSALMFFALVAGAAGMLVIGQALSRQAIVDGADDPTLRALGLGRRHLAALAAARGAVVGLTAAGVSVVVAVLASPLTPIGPVRSVEPDPGLALDAVVISVGASVIALVAVAWIAGTSWLVARRGAAGVRWCRPPR